MPRFDPALMIGAAACWPGAGLMPGLQMRISGKRGVCFVRQNVACVPNGVWERCCTWGRHVAVFAGFFGQKRCDGIVVVWRRRCCVLCRVWGGPWLQGNSLQVKLHGRRCAHGTRKTARGQGSTGGNVLATYGIRLADGSARNACGDALAACERRLRVGRRVVREVHAAPALNRFLEPTTFVVVSKKRCLRQAAPPGPLIYGYREGAA